LYMSITQTRLISEQIRVAALFQHTSGCDPS
jgi:hypothetical protein